MTIAENRRRAVKALIDRKFGGVQAKFGTAIGRQADQVSRIVTGKKPLGERLAREIERALHLQPGELDHDPTEIDSLQSAPDHRFHSGVIPIIAWDQLVRVDHKGEPTKMDVSVIAVSEVAPRPAGVSEKAYALQVRGTAMEPEFRDAVYVYVDECAPVKHGDFVIALPEGRRTPLLRQLILEGDETYLRATNPAHPEQLVPMGANGMVLGRVVYQGKSY